jgi:hypothetical protein
MFIRWRDFVRAFNRALPYEITDKRFDEVARAVIETNPQKPSEAISLTERNVPQRLTTGRQKAKDKRQNCKRQSQIAARRFGQHHLKSLRKEAARRYFSVEQFSEDLRRHLEGLPVTARPDTFSYRAEKFVKRNFAAVASAALVFLI